MIASEGHVSVRTMNRLFAERAQIRFVCCRVEASTLTPGEDARVGLCFVAVHCMRGCLFPVYLKFDRLELRRCCIRRKFGGVMAAVSSARKKLNTLLICSSWPSCFEEGGHLIGGMSSGGLGQTDIGDTYPYIGGLAREFYERNSQFYKSRKHQYLFKHSGNGADCRLPSSNCSVTYNLEPHVAEHIFNEMIKEAGVKVLYGAQVARAKFSEVESTKVSRIGKRIKSITTTSGHEIFAKIFLDASYEGDLMAAANVSHVTGREGKDDYNESLAGLSAGSKKNQFDLKINPFDDNGRPLPFITKQMPFIEFNGKKRKLAVAMT